MVAVSVAMSMSVVKLGGSLFKEGRSILRFLRDFAAERGLSIVVVPGGGPFADFIRKISSSAGISDEASHWMSILAMHQYAFFLTDGVEVPLVERLEEISHTERGAEKAGGGTCVVFLPFNLLREEDELKHSWDVSSDTIAAFVAKKLGERKIIKITDVDGIYDDKGRIIHRIHARDMIKRGFLGCVDAELPRFLAENRMRCIIVNGKRRERLEKVLLGEHVECTEILP
ncbi:MAG: 5--3-furanmethanol-phosphate kinase MfnE [Methanophagales archaeon]|nr:hypothetical protein [Methanophagales archaeon]MCU4139296.1 5--3-furanmethanol-phosphate kinase MfnE [Methanophagales archaeon]